MLGCHSTTWTMSSCRSTGRAPCSSAKSTPCRCWARERLRTRRFNATSSCCSPNLRGSFPFGAPVTRLHCLRSPFIRPCQRFEDGRAEREATKAKAALRPRRISRWHAELRRVSPQISGSLRVATDGGVKASTRLGESIQGLKQTLATGEGPWKLVSAHAEGATSTARRLQGGTSIERVYTHTQTGERLIRHSIVKGGEVLHSSVRPRGVRSEEHTSELQSRRDLVCRLLLEKKKKNTKNKQKKKTVK